MARPEVVADHRLLAALSRKRAVYARLLAFSSVVGPLKAGQWADAWRALRREPIALAVMLQRLPEALWRRFRRYVLGQGTALDMLYRSNEV